MEKRQELLMSYIRANVAPILVDFISGKDVKGAVVIPANIDNKELNGHYDGIDFMPPSTCNFDSMFLNTTSLQGIYVYNISYLEPYLYSDYSDQLQSLPWEVSH